MVVARESYFPTSPRCRWSGYTATRSTSARSAARQTARSSEVSVDWNLWDWGKRAAHVDAARASSRPAQLSHGPVVDQIAVEAPALRACGLAWNGRSSWREPFVVRQPRPGDHQLAHAGAMGRGGGLGSPAMVSRRDAAQRTDGGRARRPDRCGVGAAHDRRADLGAGLRRRGRADLRRWPPGPVSSTNAAHRVGLCPLAGRHATKGTAQSPDPGRRLEPCHVRARIPVPTRPSAASRPVPR